MRRPLILASLVVLGSIAFETEADAQWAYPGRYGQYGYSPYGNDPGAGYMAGFGAYARGRGAYLVDEANARSINADTMLKWNNALRARQAALKAEEDKQKAKDDVERKERAEERNLENGSKLNDLLTTIYVDDPSASKSRKSRTPLASSVLREIPFEWDTEAITICIDQMTAEGSLPFALRDSAYSAERANLRKVVEHAIKEDVKGDVSYDTKKDVFDAIKRFRAKFKQVVDDSDPGYEAAEEYFVTLGSLTKLLGDSNMRAILTELAGRPEVPVGELIAFMHAFNLRFGAQQQSNRSKSINH